MEFQVIGYALVGGLIPALIWLYFLLKEDARCPEPRGMITLAFLAGMIAVPLAIAPEQYAREAVASGVPLIFAWATIEEVLKYFFAAAFILWRRAVDESPDYVVYMLTVALGFAAAENALFLVHTIQNGQLAETLVTNHLRFLGSTLLHVLASSAIGFAFAWSYHLRPTYRILYAAGGLILAVVLHTAFNLLIMKDGGSQALSAFFLVWTVALVFFAAFEILKYFTYRSAPRNVC